MQTSTDLRNLLARIDRKGYPAYKDTRGAYQFPAYVLSIDHVQGDPFAAPSKLSIHVKRKAGRIPQAALSDPLPAHRPSGCAHPPVWPAGGQASFQAKGSGHSGLISISRCGQEVLERTACALDPEHGDLLLRLEVASPPTVAPSTPGAGKDPLRPAAPVRGGVPALPQSGRKAPPGSG